MAGFEQQRDNEEAVRAMVSLLGGPTGMANRNVRLTDLVPILHADPDDDLSGLRLIASRMTFDTSAGYMPPRERPEPYVYPEEAESWLVKTNRVVKGTEGLTPTEDIDHLGIAALTIAQGLEPMLMSVAYGEATDNQSPLDPGMVKAIAHLMVDEFVGDPSITRF